MHECAGKITSKCTLSACFPLYALDCLSASSKKHEQGYYDALKLKLTRMCASLRKRYQTQNEQDLIMQGNGKQIIAIFLRKHDHNIYVYVLYMFCFFLSLGHFDAYTDFHRLLPFSMYQSVWVILRAKKYTGFSLQNLFQIVCFVWPSPHSFLYSVFSNIHGFSFSFVCSALQICANVFYSSSQWIPFFFLALFFNIGHFRSHQLYPIPKRTINGFSSFWALYIYFFVVCMNQKNERLFCFRLFFRITREKNSLKCFKNKPYWKS